MTTANIVPVSIEQYASAFARIRANIETVIQGKPEIVSLAVACLMAEGHLLVEDVPGVGKTSLARALAGSIDGSLQRIQFTPDLLPSDLTGVQIYSQAREVFEFHPGPVFANIVVADEINRASPKTQSALLQVMEEQQVTIDRETLPVPMPFMVVATQNPIDLDGTYRLPEAQLDRFLMRLTVGYPDHDAEYRVLETQADGATVGDLRPVLTTDDVQRMVAATTQVEVAPQLRHYVIGLVDATRRLPELRLGASPRGSLAIIRAARALAAAAGRSYVVPEDIKALAVPVLAHRLILSPEAEIQGLSSAALLERLMQAQPVPMSTSQA